MEDFYIKISNKNIKIVSKNAYQKLTEEFLIQEWIWMMDLLIRLKAQLHCVSFKKNFLRLEGLKNRKHIHVHTYMMMFFARIDIHMEPGSKFLWILL